MNIYKKKSYMNVRSTYICALPAQVVVVCYIFVGFLCFQYYFKNSLKVIML